MTEEGGEEDETGRKEKDEAKFWAPQKPSIKQHSLPTNERRKEGSQKKERDEERDKLDCV